jgi:hypothetical protein
MRKKTDEATSVVYRITTAGMPISFQTKEGKATRCGNKVVLPAALAPAFEKAFSKQISSGRLVREETGFLTTAKAEAAPAIQAQPSARVAVEETAAASAEAANPEEKKSEETGDTPAAGGRRGGLTRLGEGGGS